MKKVLFFTYDFPYPTNSGGKNRAFHMLSETAKNVEIHLFSFVRPDFDEKYFKNLRDIGVTRFKTFPRPKASIDQLVLNQSKRPTASVFHSLYYSRKIEQEVLQYIKSEKIELVHCESFYTGYYLSEKIRELGVSQIFGTENIEFNLYKEYVAASVRPFLRPFYKFQTILIEREEKAMYKKADMCLAVSRIEAEEIQKMGARRCEVVENGVDMKEFSYKERKQNSQKNMLFLGNFVYFPNIDAVRFFYDSVFLKFKEDNIRFTIVGKNASKVFSNIHDSRVAIIDFVPDIKKLYDEADVFVFPVRYGGGTNFKIIEAMACGVPVVGFPQRLEGLNVMNSDIFLPAHDGESFYKQIQTVFKDPDMAKKMTINARWHVEKQYSWETIGRKLNTLWKEI